MYIAIDFDGTVVTHEYPAIGSDIGAIPWLQTFINRGAKLILNTMRCDRHLVEAVQFFTDNNILLFGVNRNPDQDWTTSPKVYAHLYIDDAAFGCPLKDGHVDWDIVGPLVLKMLNKG